MMIDAIHGRTTQILDKAMALRTARQGLLASNIANAETPNYRAVDIDFAATMERLVAEAEKAGETKQSGTVQGMGLKREDPRHLSLESVPEPEGEPKPRILFAAGDAHSIGNDNNTVSLEEQMARLQSNTMMFSALSRLLGKKLGGIDSIVESSSRE